MKPEEDAYDLDPIPAAKPPTSATSNDAAESAAPATGAGSEEATVSPDLGSAGPSGTAESPAREGSRAKSTGAASAGDATTPRRPLVRNARFEWPLALAGCAAAILVAAYLAGQQGLFPASTTTNSDGVAVATVIEWSDRFMMVLKGVLRIIVAGGCLVAGAYFLHFLDRRPVGDLRALASRMIAISAVSLLAMMFPIDILFLKRMFDALVPLAIAWALLIPFFRVSMRDAGVIMLGALMSLTVLAFGSMIVNFAVR
ncbi:MAG: hypothetical protein SGJ09_14420 [Phycisphaerae bacterium]|nr:hypothetical protein [Phycisphaerae bacterium]